VVGPLAPAWPCCDCSWLPSAFPPAFFLPPPVSVFLTCCNILLAQRSRPTRAKGASRDSNPESIVEARLLAPNQIREIRDGLRNSRTPHLPHPPRLKPLLTFHPSSAPARRSA